jgi:transcriptional regulator with XRE-family HTH domain
MKKRSTSADAHVAARIRERRISLGLTQSQFAELIGVTFQQAHKYERGMNRVSAGRLYEISRVLKTPVAFFYDGLQNGAPAQDEQESDYSRARLTIARALVEVREPKKLALIHDVVRALA